MNTRSNTSRVSFQGALLTSLAALLAMGLVGIISRALVGETGAPWLVASMGAASVLLFAASASPMAQPWSLLGGHFISAIIGVSCYQLIPDANLAAASAVSLAILFMILGRCLHPPGGATALGAVIGGDAITQLGFNYVLAPVMLNTGVILLIAWLVNNAIPGRVYPASRQQTSSTGVSDFLDSDIETALSEMGSYLDISKQDLMRVYEHALNHASKRNLGNLSCEQVMSSPVLSLNYSDSLDDAWHQLEKAGYQSAPVVDSANRVTGIVTKNDLMRATRHEDPGLGAGLRKLLTTSSDENVSKQVELIGHIMQHPVTTIPASAHIIDALQQMNSHNFHQLPVVNENQTLCGILTRTDLLQVMARNSTTGNELSS